MHSIFYGKWGGFHLTKLGGGIRRNNKDVEIKRMTKQQQKRMTMKIYAETYEEWRSKEKNEKIPHCGTIVYQGPVCWSLGSAPSQSSSFNPHHSPTSPITTLKFPLKVTFFKVMK